MDYIERRQQAMGQLGIGGGRLAVAGLNPPHLGNTACLATRKSGKWNRPSPKPKDAAFGSSRPHRCRIRCSIKFSRTGAMPPMLCLYHDQGHIATKTLDFERTISLTLGLPFLRTSVDHGTAFDIAWQGQGQRREHGGIDASGGSMPRHRLMPTPSVPHNHTTEIPNARHCHLRTQMLLGLWDRHLFSVFLILKPKVHAFWRDHLGGAHRHHRRHADARRHQIHYHRFWQIRWAASAS